MQTRKKWKNYVNDQRADPLQFFTPQNLDDLQNILAEAKQQGLKVKALGSGHSSSDIAISRDIMIDTHGLDRVLDKKMLNLNVPEHNLFFVEAGIRIHVLNQVLEVNGKALINMGAYDGQTVAGVISTSTHGSGISLGAFPDYLKTIFLLTEDGTLYQIERASGEGISKGAAKIPGLNRIELIQNDQYFFSVGVSMGCMGIIYAVVLEVCDKYMLKECRYFSDWKTMKPKLAAQNILKNNRHVEVLVSPYLNKKGQYKCLVTERNIEAAKYKSPLIPRGHRKIIPELGVRLIPKVLDFFIRLIINHFPSCIPSVAQGELNTLTDRDYIDKSFMVLNLGADNNLAAFATEIALPSDRYLEGVEEIIRIVNKSVNDGRQYLSSPFSLRFVKTNSFYLSMQYGRPGDFICMIEFPTVSKTIGDTELLARIEDALYAFGGIPHWGQINHVGGQGRSAVQKLYPCFGNWMQVYKRLCPEGRFENDFTHRCGISHFNPAF